MALNLQMMPSNLLGALVGATGQGMQGTNGINAQAYQELVRRTGGNQSQIYNFINADPHVRSAVQQYLSGKTSDQMKQGFGALAYEDQDVRNNMTQQQWNAQVDPFFASMNGAGLQQYQHNTQPQWAQDIANNPNIPQFSDPNAVSPTNPYGGVDAAHSGGNLPPGTFGGISNPGNGPGNPNNQGVGGGPGNPNNTAGNSDTAIQNQLRSTYMNSPTYNSQGANTWGIQNETIGNLRGAFGGGVFKPGAGQAGGNMPPPGSTGLGGTTGGNMPPPGQVTSDPALPGTKPYSTPSLPNAPAPPFKPQQPISDPIGGWGTKPSPDRPFQNGPAPPFKPQQPPGSVAPPGGGVTTQPQPPTTSWGGQTLTGNIGYGPGQTRPGSFAAGTNLVPQDQLAQIHAGEAILPANQNPWNPNQGFGGAMSPVDQTRNAANPQVNGPAPPFNPGAPVSGPAPPFNPQRPQDPMEFLKKIFQGGINPMNSPAPRFMGGQQSMTNTRPSPSFFGGALGR